MIKKVVEDKIIITIKISMDQIGSQTYQKYKTQMKKILIISIALLTIVCSCKTSKNADCDAYSQNVSKDSTITYF